MSSYKTSSSVIPRNLREVVAQGMSQHCNYPCDNGPVRRSQRIPGGLNMIGIEVAPRLKRFSPILEEWQSLIAQSALEFPQTEGSWYNERTLGGLLSAATWRRGIPSIVEAKTARRAATERNGAGHLDVLMRIDGRLAAFELKTKWFSDSDGAEGVLGVLESAFAEASGLGKNYHWRIAIACGLLERHRTITCRAVLDAALVCFRRIKPALLCWNLEDKPGVTGLFAGCISVGTLIR
jgi:hypothetical protein